MTSAMTLLLMAARVVDVASGELVNATLARDVSISADNPFFVNGSLILPEVPQSLIHSLLTANCTRAWRRQQHKTSALDRQCNQMVRSFLFGTPGSVMGLYDAVMNYRVPKAGQHSQSDFYRQWGRESGKTPLYTTVVTEDLVVESAAGVQPESVQPESVPA
jgi:hypothetical protein